MMRGDRGKRKIKEEKISKEYGFVSRARTDLSFLLDELQHLSVNGSVVSGDRQMVTHITALHPPSCPREPLPCPDPL